VRIIATVRIPPIADILSKLQNAGMWSITLAAAALAASSAQAPRMEAVEVREFDPNTGQWLASTRFKNDFFNGWNWRFLDHEGSNDDLEIVFAITATPGSVLDVPFTVTIDSRGKAIDQRRYTKLHILKSGKLYQLLHLRDLACAGPVYVTASLGAESRSLKLGTECGE
jgi:hypothetical protein